MPAKIFISYRRDDTSANASNLQNRLQSIFGRKNVFMDVDNLLAGQRFDEELNKALQNCDVFLAVIGPKWMDILSARLKAGGRGLDQRDFVREEIATALKRNIVVIPVLVDNATLPAASALPADIQDLVFYQKHDITHERFGRDVEDLAAAIRAVRKARAQSAKLPWGIIAAAAMVLSVAAGGVALFYNLPDGPLVARLTSDEKKRKEEAARQAEAERRRQAELEAEANRKAEETARKAEAERQRQAELERQRKAAEQAEARRKAEQAAAEKRRLAELTRPGRVFRDCQACPEMVVVLAGSFMMGSPSSEKGRDSDEGPQRRVTIPRPFAVGKFEITWAEWEACVADNGCDGSGPEKAGGDNGWGKGRRPVIEVSWNDATAYAAWLSKKTGKIYRLLSEAEWEYVARAGTTTAFSWGDEISAEQANYDGNYTYGDGSKGKYRQKTVPVDSFDPNPWGLYQMHGNVWE